MAIGIFPLVELAIILVVLVIIGVVLGAIIFEPILSYDPAQDLLDQPMTCPNCEASYESPDSAVCWNCGADLVAYSRIGEANQARAEIYRGVEARHREESERSISIGKCMVCKFDVRDTEEAIWCPRCGTIAHRDHFLEWLHVKHCCPVCKEHLNEERLRQLMQ